MKNKLKSFELLCIEEEDFDIRAYIEFLKKNLDSNADVTLLWEIYLEEEFTEELVPALKAIEESWEPQIERPKFCLCDGGTINVDRSEVILGELGQWDEYMRTYAYESTSESTSQ